jgi:hypothetical protein
LILENVCQKRDSERKRERERERKKEKEKDRKRERERKRARKREIGRYLRLHHAEALLPQLQYRVYDHLADVELRVVIVREIVLELPQNAVNCT